MGAAGSGSSGKVTVEYSDPFGIYPTISQDLSQLLPLRNLHWKSASRPLRSIKALHIELCPNVLQLQTLNSPLSPPETVQVKESTATSTPVSALRDEVPSAPNNLDTESKKGRRHQIPGLRRTPYLKLFLLRCDDVDTYKASSRKLLREWVKEHTSPSQSSNVANAQENHDAFEWLIVHVVAPAEENTIHNQDSTSSSGSSTRSTLGLVEKVRSDFNGTSKSAVDRVAQIHARPKASVSDSRGSSISLSDTEPIQQRFGWDDLISKMKSLILASLDLRVMQYEEDIREKESQRNLPGWNFCTFFVLKEGLARGFESVGLIEDALSAYHELSVGLDTLVGEHCGNDHSNENPSLFASYTEDLLDVVLQAYPEKKAESLGSLNRQSQHPTDIPTMMKDNGFGSSILDTDRKPFRQLILANTISAFDFLCYIFARQMVLLLRLANVHSPGDAPKSSSSRNATLRSSHRVKDDAQISESVTPEDENLLVLAQACGQAVSFINSTARMLRRDLQISIQKIFPQNPREDVIGNMVSCWKYSVSQLILEQTNVPSLRIALQDYSAKSQGSSEKDPRLSQSIEVSQLAAAPRSDEHPARSSSMITRSPQSDIAIETGNPSNLNKFSKESTSRLITGFQELAAQRGELFRLKRSALSRLGRREHWACTWAVCVHGSQPIDMHEITLQDGSQTSLYASDRRSEDSEKTDLFDIQDPDLKASLGSRDRYGRAYEILTALALRHDHLSARPSTSENMTADLAVAQYQVGNFEAAASLCHDLGPSYASKGWLRLELITLQLHARCLMSLGRDEDFVRINLRILAKFLESEAIITKTGQKPGKDGELATSSVCKMLSLEGSSSLGQLLEASKKLKKPMVVPMADYFGDIRLVPYVRHHEDQDSYEMTIEIEHIISEELPVQYLKVKLLGDERMNGNEIWLTTTHAQMMQPGTNKVIISSQVMYPGWYNLSAVTLQSENLVFTYEVRKSGIKAISANFAGITTPESVYTSCNVLLWPSSTALRALLSPHSFIHLEQPRAIEVEICPGQNAILQGRLVIKAGSAGLRLHTGDAEPMNGSASILRKPQPGHIEFIGLSPNTSLQVKVPFRLETDLQEILVKIEVHYTTCQGDFTFGCNSTISVALPLGVNVQDIFKSQALYSRFTISTVNSVPLRVFSAYMEGNNDFEITSPSMVGIDLDIFARQPLSLTARIQRRSQTLGQRFERKLQTKLLLQVCYDCFDREIYHAVDTCFAMAIKHTSSERFQHLLLPNLLGLIHSRCSLPEFESIAVLREFRLDAYDRDEWNHVMAAIEPRIRHEVEAWLVSWYKEYKTIKIPLSSANMKVHQIVIPVELPSLDVVHTARLRILEKSPEKSKYYIAAAGTIIKAELSIWHSRSWRADGLPPFNASGRLDFYYDLHANPDSWLIGGRRTAHFSAEEKETLTFPVLLLPQRVGHLLFPAIEIQARDTEENKLEGHPQRRSSALPISCEVDYRSQGETLQVLSGLQSTTVNLDPSDPASTPCLVESRSW